MEIVLKITQELPIQEGVGKNGNPWRVASFIGETQEQYSRKVCFEIFGEERIKNNPCKIDDVVTVSFDIESREFNGRWYTSIRAWKVALADESQNNTQQEAPAVETQPVAQPAEAPAAQPATTIAPKQAPIDGDGTDLPF